MSQSHAPAKLAAKKEMMAKKMFASDEEDEMKPGKAKKKGAQKAKSKDSYLN